MKTFSEKTDTIDQVLEKLKESLGSISLSKSDAEVMSRLPLNTDEDYDQAVKAIEAVLPKFLICKWSGSVRKTIKIEFKVDLGTIEDALYFYIPELKIKDTHDGVLIKGYESDIRHALNITDGLYNSVYNNGGPGEYYCLLSDHDLSDTDWSKLIAESKFSKNMKTFSIKKSIRTFSEITTPEQFRKYAHTVMKNAHGDDYSEEVTDKVVDDLLANNPDADFGELIGRLTSGFGE